MKKYVVLGILISLVLVGIANTNLEITERPISGGVRISVVIALPAYRFNTPWVFEKRFLLTLKNWGIEEIELNTTLHPLVLSRLAQ